MHCIAEGGGAAMMILTTCRINQQIFKDETYVSEPPPSSCLSGTTMQLRRTSMKKEMLLRSEIGLTAM